MDIVSALRRHSLIGFFGLAYALSLVALAVVGPPRLSDGGSVPMSSLLMFPILVIGVGLSGLAMTLATTGSAGLRALVSRQRRWRLGRWAWVLLVPPIGILAVLLGLRTFVSPGFTPSFLVFGVAAGVLAGFFEEIGWTGFALPRMTWQFGQLRGPVLLGLLWGLWHFPIVDSLGATSPHGRYLPAFFMSFVALVVAVRVLIAWLYQHTDSLLAAQLLHASSTGSLVALSAPHVSPAQETLWYVVYAAVLWLIVASVVLRSRAARGADRLGASSAIQSASGPQ